MRFFVGAYAAGMDGSAEGIGVLHAGDPESPWASGALGTAGLAVREPGSPSWLAPHPALDVLYAALEGEGTVRAYRRTGETTLAPLGAPVEAGSAVCHVAVSPDGAFLLASCWGDGRVVRIGLDAEGRPSSRALAAAAADPYADGGIGASGPLGSGAAAPGASVSGAGAPDAGGLRPPTTGSALPDLAAAARALREAAGDEYAHLVPGYDEPAPAANAEPAASPERGSRAHAAIFVPGGFVATTDLGYDLVRIWRVAAAGIRLVQEVPLPRGSGPRHGVWHASGHLYVVTEYSCEVFVLAADREGVWRVVSGVALGRTLPGDSAAELAPSRDGETLYAGVRGSDTIAALRVRGSGEAVAFVALVESGTHWPRHHVVVRDTLLVAGQLADEIVSLPLDERTGVPGRVRHRTASPSPTRLLPVR